jgi:hypothetical protein
MFFCRVELTDASLFCGQVESSGYDGDQFCEPVRQHPALTMLPLPLAWFYRMMQTEKHQAPRAGLPSSTPPLILNLHPPFGFGTGGLKFLWILGVAGRSLGKH